MHAERFLGWGFLGQEYLWRMSSCLGREGVLLCGSSLAGLFCTDHMCGVWVGGPGGVRGSSALPY